MVDRTPHHHPALLALLQREGITPELDKQNGVTK